MVNVLWLATEASAEEGFGLNLDLLDTNLINLGILIVVLIYFGRGFIGKILSERRATIEQAIKEAEKRQQEAASALAAQQQKLTQAQVEAETILATAETRAQEVKQKIEQQAEQDIERMKATASQEMDSERDKAIAQLRSIVASKALAQVESRLKETLDENAQQQLIDRSLGLLGGQS
ncbi:MULTISPECIES: F0F1 ATP synthase subunit B [Okeania]|uniref:ATP synthase subunit b n=1 Tax=Okeania hirsuta TaxID=1458930 RepID=A0A3N6RWM6_9CYAN|nr:MULTISPECIES: F0F1 ATP synthase subunit B [Okeania]NET15518.1 F0F1 ATP synthase subunit B [Okeania sp. SIO1H6]NES75834.1 F0F1 ATP synthase subunit B [Okeania sp. SIO1H4]NES92182.1 F0F1 ATP synthase subunit B [Okeania sp. SIO2B9]NET20018.1 F0F1 ATP synthase subunit B [Okeania sp. SIO1H5]NET75528.1 F0F1 ATP synthase subunit B [Okeania sp. SIO1F9]